MELAVRAARLTAMLVSNKAISFGAVSILHAVATGSRFGFDIMDATGFTSGTVYPTLDRLERAGLLASSWENPSVARAERRPARRYFRLTAEGAAALATALQKYKTLRPVAFEPDPERSEG
jgi:PadR family transcriptional regulator PadR